MLGGPVATQSSPCGVFFALTWMQILENCHALGLFDIFVHTKETFNWQCCIQP